MVEKGLVGSCSCSGVPGGGVRHIDQPKNSVFHDVFQPRFVRRPSAVSNQTIQARAWSCMHRWRVTVRGGLGRPARRQCARSVALRCSAARSCASPRWLGSSQINLMSSIALLVRAGFFGGGVRACHRAFPPGGKSWTSGEGGQIHEMNLQDLDRGNLAPPLCPGRLISSQFCSDWDQSTTEKVPCSLVDQADCRRWRAPGPPFKHARSCARAFVIMHMIKPQDDTTNTNPEQARRPSLCRDQENFFQGGLVHVRIRKTFRLKQQLQLHSWVGTTGLTPDLPLAIPEGWHARTTNASSEQATQQSFGPARQRPRAGLTPQHTRASHFIHDSTCAFVGEDPPAAFVHGQARTCEPHCTHAEVCGILGHARAFQGAPTPSPRPPSVAHQNLRPEQCGI